MLHAQRAGFIIDGFIIDGFIIDAHAYKSNIDGRESSVCTELFCFFRKDREECKKRLLACKDIC